MYPFFYFLKKMIRFAVTVLLLGVALLAVSCKDDDATPGPPVSKNFTLTAVSLDGRPLSFHYAAVSITPEIRISFSEPIDHTTLEGNITLGKGTGFLPLNFTRANGDSTVIIQPTSALNYLTTYNLFVSAALASTTEKTFGSTTSIKIVTTYDPADKFPIITDDALLDLVQEKTFQYFWDFAHPISGMARERNSSGNTVTSGGSGFGLMSIIVGMERGFITRDEGVGHLDKVLDFLETSDRFHGAWSHWIDGNTGKTIPFSADDNGGDLVETSFLMQSLITFRQYLDPDTEQDLIDRINALWETVEWDWYTKNNENVLYWHWSPDKGWIMNHQISGYNECLITYVLAASSTTHAITADVYTQGFARNGGMKNGKTFYGFNLPLILYPLFFSRP
jgi:hypothetical protein